MQVKIERLQTDKVPAINVSLKTLIGSCSVAVDLNENIDGLMSSIEECINTCIKLYEDEIIKKEM